MWCFGQEGHFERFLGKALAAKQAAEKGRVMDKMPKNIPQGLKPVDSAGFMYGLKPVPFTEWSFSAACKAASSQVAPTAEAEAVPIQI
jgi:hypothetical protein